MHPCRWCGQPVKQVKAAGGWLHALPLAEFKVSRRELQDILEDPPRPGWYHHRGTHIHPAQPE